ncbi:hypothetical protein G6F50_015219 [Rhizopus delemar]|uniref:Uncharacterized protein n=1 Tax=Rhizopus delemar TaxID=936053 RepID=A0A9P6XZ63_9FUNG|nr:hypothetical protein G6F50_015219 [Rhizopus delemar]
MSTGTTSRLIAVGGGSTSDNSGTATSGSPTPRAPLTTPAPKKASPANPRSASAGIPVKVHGTWDSKSIVVSSIVCANTRNATRRSVGHEREY